VNLAMTNEFPVQLAAISRGNVKPGPVATTQMQLGYCSGCCNFTLHRKQQDGTYVCDREFGPGCGCLTSPCSAASCAHMAAMAFCCAEHDNTIVKFGRLHASIDEVDGYSQILGGRHEEKCDQGEILGLKLLEHTNFRCMSFEQACDPDFTKALQEKAMEAVMRPFGIQITSNLLEFAKTAYAVYDAYGDRHAISAFQVLRAPDWTGAARVVLVQGWQSDDCRTAKPYLDQLEEFCNLTTRDTPSVFCVRWLSHGSPGSMPMPGADFGESWLSTLAKSILANPWHTAVKHANTTGRLLGLVVRQTRACGHMPTRHVLIGHSLGARVLFRCLLALADQPGCAGLVHHVVLLGGAVGNAPNEWEKVAKVVRGRIYNCFSKEDSVLKYLYRTFTPSFTGVGPWHEHPLESHPRSKGLYSPWFCNFCGKKGEGSRFRCTLGRCITSTADSANLTDCDRLDVCGECQGQAQMQCSPIGLGPINVRAANVVNIDCSDLVARMGPFGHTYESELAVILKRIKTRTPDFDLKPSSSDEPSSFEWSWVPEPAVQRRYDTLVRLPPIVRCRITVKRVPTSLGLCMGHVSLRSSALLSNITRVWCCQV
jgi:hypothetical protein